VAITNGYTTVIKVAEALQISVTDHDTLLEYAVEAASRQIDAYCGKGRRFWQDSEAVARQYYPQERRRLHVDDVSTTTGLAVKIDMDDDGTYETTLTINQDFIVEPVNAAAESPVRPFTTIALLDGTITGWSKLSSGRPYVQVTAKFGWPAVPIAVERACVMQAKNVFKAPDLMYGSFQLSSEGTPLNAPSMDPVARALLENYVRWDQVDDHE